MAKQTRQNNKISPTNIIGGIVGFCSLLGSAMTAHADTFTLTELNFHIEKCFEATTIPSASTRYCDRLLNNRIKPRKVEANALYNRGVIRFQQQNFDAAKSDFSSALDKNNKLYQAHIALGEIAIRQQNYSKALNHYEIVIAQQGSNKALEKKRQGLKAKLEFANRTNEM